MDFPFDVTADGRRLILLHVIDENTLLCCRSAWDGVQAKDMLAVLEDYKSLYQSPAFLCSDNAPEFIAHALGCWCQYSSTTTVYILPSYPSQNGFSESFSSRFRD